MDKELLVNELGDIMISPNGTVYKLCNHEQLDENLYKSLVANYFITEQLLPSTIDIYANRLRTKKGFLDSSIGLHIFVLTLRCNQNCIYCQASSKNQSCTTYSMSQETLKSAVKLMFESKSKDLTMEFQGGEPSLEYDLLKLGIEEAEKYNKVEKRNITYVLCTNCIDLSDELLCLCKQYNVQISTSLDGPEFIHNKNRGRMDSYKNVICGIDKARSYVGHSNVNALMTASNIGVDYPIEIVNEYIRLGFNSIFLRALNPYGLASENENWERYSVRLLISIKQLYLIL